MPTANKRYTPDELELWYFVPSIASKTAPTSTEVTAGTDITGSINAVAGFTEQGQFVTVQDLSSRVDAKIPGRIQLADSSITFYKSSVTGSPDDTVYTALPKDTTGFICRFHPKAGAKQTVASASTCDVWPVTVASRSVQPPKPGEVVTFVVDFAVTSTPAFDAALAS